MSIVSEVKCPRCDRRYSGIRGRCPYCGARRMGRGKHANSGENTKGKIIIGLLLMGVLIVAVVVLLIANLGGEPKEPEVTDTPPPVEQTDEDISRETGTTDPEPSTTPSSTITDPPTSSETPQQTVESVTITYVGVKKEDITLKIGESVPLKAKIVPDNYEGRVEWSSSNEAVFTVTPESGLITGISAGEADLILTADDKTAVCKIRVSTERFSG